VARRRTSRRSSCHRASMKSVGIPRQASSPTQWTGMVIASIGGAVNQRCCSPGSRTPGEILTACSTPDLPFRVRFRRATTDVTGRLASPNRPPAFSSTAPRPLGKAPVSSRRRLGAAASRASDRRLRRPGAPVVGRPNLMVASGLRRLRRQRRYRWRGVEQYAGRVRAHGRPGIGVRGRFLHVSQGPLASGTVVINA
jgi:hypothetical protein